jgi:hypothetical protein
MVVNATIMAWIYGDQYDQFLPQWIEAIESLETKPKRVIVCSDKPRDIPCAEVLVIPRKDTWNVPNPYYANIICNFTDTEWMLLMDIDDVIRPDCLSGLDKVEADVWLMGIEISGEGKYFPPRMSNESIYSDANCYFCFGSPFKREWALQFPFEDSPYTDWIFWREIARHNAKFQWSDKIGYRYRKDFANSMSGWANAEPKWREQVLNEF